MGHIVYFNSDRVSLRKALKHDTVNTYSYNSILLRLHDANIVFLNRSALKLYDFVRIVIYFVCHSKADSIRIEIHNRPPGKDK